MCVVSGKNTNHKLVCQIFSDKSSRPLLFLHLLFFLTPLKESVLILLECKETFNNNDCFNIAQALNLHDRVLASQLPMIHHFRDDGIETQEVLQLSQVHRVNMGWRWTSS